jgi:pilus assembly protein CpaE
MLLHDERGIELIEFLGFFPLVLLILVLAWQFILVGYTGIVANGAAREGARAAVVREDIDQAVRFASPGFDGRRQWTMLSAPCIRGTRAPVRIQVQLEVPHVTFPFVGALNAYPKVIAEATMRCEPPYQSP